MPRTTHSSGQAAVELVALLPWIAALVAIAWQLVLAGQAAAGAQAAARAAARAAAVGADAGAAARAHLPPRLEHGLRVHTRAEGGVDVRVRIPTVLPAIRLGTTSAAAHFEPQSP